MSAGRRPTAAGTARPASRPRVGSRPAPAGARAQAGPAPVKGSAGRPARADGSPSRTRPARARPTPARPTRARPTRARRIVVLAGVFCVLAVLLAPALRAYLAQQQQVAALRAKVTAQRLQVQELSQERAAWNDDAFVKAQARERLKFVLPGERALTVIDDPATASRPASASTDPQQRAAQAARPGRAWFSDVWSSLGAAGRSPAGPR